MTGRAPAKGRPLASSLEVLLGWICEQMEIESAVIVVVEPGGALAVEASIGLDAAALAGLAAAIQDPGHPIARTATDPTATFDVAPTRPGGPALRSHVPLVVVRGGTDVVVGVLALAHERSISTERRSLVLAGADLAAVAIELQDRDQSAEG